ncbi:MAG: chromosome segregation SMC family protein, partial [Armatimonadaceae bacterium]
MGVRMRLKRLTLQGFKTFADRTEIEFVPGVTCIVGPNGSGKSNLLDALVWCLGDTKASSVRATRAQDVIFAGSAKRKPMGMAEVSLTVENEDRFLPLDFNEVTITRRVYRNGEGEYFINKAACRLRDITDLFLDTGVGKGAYAIVNQSEIDAILSARPEDRRELFEEAAGIKKYRVRKREAQRKLENTESNLIRVRDILSELDTQVEPLRLQSELALRHRELTERLRTVEVGQLAADHKRLKDEINELASGAAQAVAEATTADDERSGLEAGAEQLGLRIAAAEERLEGARLRQQTAMTESERLESRIALSEQRIVSSRAALESLEQDVAVAVAEAERCDLDAVAAAADWEIEREKAQGFESGLADSAARLRGIEESLAQVQAAMAGREADLQQLARTLERHRLEQAALRERIGRRRSDLDELGLRRERRSAEIEAAKSDVQALAEAREAATAGHAAAVAAVRETHEPELARRTAAVQDALDQRTATERELASAESRLAALEETEAALEGY